MSGGSLKGVKKQPAIALRSRQLANHGGGFFAIGTSYVEVRASADNVITQQGRRPCEFFDAFFEKDASVLKSTSKHQHPTVFASRREARAACPWRCARTAGRDCDTSPTACCRRRTPSAACPRPEMPGRMTSPCRRLDLSRFSGHRAGDATLARTHPVLRPRHDHPQPD